MSYRVRKEVWVQKFLNKLLPKQAVKSMHMLSDNETSFTLTKNLESQNQTKHIDVMYHHLRGLVKDGELGMK